MIKIFLFTMLMNRLSLRIYDSKIKIMVGLGRLELPTSRLSGVRSNQAELQARYSD